MSEFGPFRPLTPLVEADGAVFLPSGPPRLQRLRDRAALVEAVTTQSATVLVGPSGSGKTSLVRAGLVPAMRSRGWEVFGPEEAMVSAQSVLVVDDALATDADVDGLLPALTAAASAGAAILLVVDDNDLWRLQALEARTGRLPGRVDLRPLGELEVGQLVEEAVLAGGAYFEAGLAGVLAEDLTRNGPVTPALIQLAAASMVVERVTTARAFRTVGGLEALRDRFFTKAACAATPPDGRAARRILSELAAAPSTTVASLADAAELGPAAATAALQALQQRGLVRRRSDGTVALASEWLRPLLTLFTAVERQAAIAARASLRRAAMRPLPVLGPRELANVRRHAGQLDEADGRLAQRSRWLWRGAVAVALATPLVFSAARFLGEARHCHLSTDGTGPGASVVLRLGSPSGWAQLLPHRPAFGAPLVDTGWVRGSLGRELPRQSLLHREWAAAVRAGLRPVPQAAASWLVEGNLAPLAALFDDVAARSSVLALLELAGSGGDAAEMTVVRRALAAGSSEDTRRQGLAVAAAWLRRGRPAGSELLTEVLRGKAQGGRAVVMQMLASALKSDDVALRGRVVSLLAAATLLEDAAVRRSAMELLVAEAERGTAGARAALVASLSGPGRTEAAVVLGARAEGAQSLVDGEETAKALATMVLDPKVLEDVRLEALALLARRVGEPPVLTALAAVPGSARWQAAALPWTLRGKPVEEVWPRVQQAAHAAVPMRAAAATLLASGSLPKSAETTKLIKTLSQDSNGEVRAAGVHALVTLGGEGQTLLVKALKNGGADAERAVVEVVANEAAKRPSLAPLLELAARSPRIATRRAAFAALGRLSTEKPAAALPALGRLSRDKSAELRAASVQALGVALTSDRGARDATGLLRILNRDADAAIRRQAVAALAAARGAGRTATAPAAKAAASFGGDIDAGVRAEAASTLGALGAADANWTGWLRDRDPGVRAAARRAALPAALGLKATAELDAAVSDGLAAATATERNEWAALAGALGLPGALGLALSHPVVEVRRAATASMRPTTNPPLASLEAAIADEDVEVRRDALQALAGAKPGLALPVLTAALASSDPRTRVAALRALANHPPETAPDPAWVALVERGLADGSEMVRVAAAVAVGTLGPAGHTLVESALGDPARDVREAGAVSAARLWQGLPTNQLAALEAARTDGKPASFERRAAALWAGATLPLSSASDDSDTPLLRALGAAQAAGATRPDELGRLLSLVR